jgi:hypothetical protein
MISRREILALSATAIALLAAGSAATPPSQAKIVADAINAADWVAGALSASGYRADFSMASLAEIDRFFDDQAPGGTVKPDGLLSEQLGSRLFAIGSYVGETLRRNLGGEWAGNDADPEAEINIALKLSGRGTIWPVQRTMKRFRNGREDGIATYGAALAEAR